METWQEQTPSATPADPAGAELTSVRFAEVARRLGRAAVALGLTAPAFRSPPKQPGLQRSITRRSDGSATVAVAIRGRPAVAVAADMIDGVLAANRPTGHSAKTGRPAKTGRAGQEAKKKGARSGQHPSAETRDQLWAAVVPCLAASSEHHSSVPATRRRPVEPVSSPRSGSAERRAA